MANKKVVFEGLAYYAKVQEPSDMAQAYTVDVVVPDTKFQTLLISEGILPAKKIDGTAKTHTEDNAPVFIAKRKLLTRTGVSLGKPLVLNSDGNPMTDLIGNGSKVKVTATVYPVTFNGKTFQKLGLDSVQVLELVPYNKPETKESII